MFDTLNREQFAAVHHQGSPLLIVAGAGTGKTRTLVARVCRLVEDGVDPQRIMLLTFTRRAAAEMLARVGAATTSRAAEQIFGGTFHAIANRILRDMAPAVGLSNGFTVLDSDDAIDLMGVVRTEHALGEGSRRFPRKETVAAIYGRMVSGQAPLSQVLEKDYPWCANHADALRAIFVAYTERKRKHGVLDFDDLLLFWRGITVSPAGSALRDRFDHILIDEYQDTNGIQAEIVAGMTRPETDLCAVGDDAQAIYGFRSATVANMWRFTETFPEATRINLEQNYRSTMPILRVANGLLQQSRDHFDKQLWSTRETGVTPNLHIHHDEHDQSAAVADAVLDARERGMDLRIQAVLFRAGHHSAGLELELTRRHIPFVKFGGLKYLETAHVKDLLALLRILDNPDDQLAWHRVLGTLEGVGPATIRRLSESIGLDVPDHHALDRFIDGAGAVPPAAVDQASELRAALADCAAPGSGLGPAQQIDRLAGFCALVFPNRYDNAAARLADVQQLAATASVYPNRSRFLAELTFDPPGRSSQLAGPPHLDDDWLTLSTIHSAKGLEWSAVHLIHAADGNLPSDMAIGDEAGLAEELRLTYVAFTRARDELSVHMPLRFHVHRHATDDRHVLGQLSRFVDPLRPLFDESKPTIPHATSRIDPDLCPVGVADEVDTLLASLWE